MKERRILSCNTDYKLIECGNPEVSIGLKDAFLIDSAVSLGCKITRFSVQYRP